MNKLVFCTLLSILFLGSCSKDDDCHCVNNNDLISPELADIKVATGGQSTAFTGVLMVYPCEGDSSLYYGNYSAKGDLWPVNATYSIKDGSVYKASVPVRLPLGDYNFLYWGLAKNSQTDSVYDASAIKEPGLRLGANLSELYLTMYQEGYGDTTYMPVYDYLHAVNPIKVGTDKMQATLKHAVAGLKVTLTNKNGTKMDSSIGSARILVGNIASRLNYYSAEPSDFTKTVAFPLSMSADSMSMSANSTVMVFPSSANPPLTILLTLKNGQVKRFQKPLASALTAGNRLSLNITLGDLYSEETSSDGFEVLNWTESTETINFPAGL
ncbi:FimB/Mfa2 family fimbrial subunit [Parabacteroides sp.]